MKIIDIKEMPGYNPAVKDNVDSVSKGLVKLEANPWFKRYVMSEGGFFYAEYPACITHGAMNKVSRDGIWRCLACGAGCYEKA